MTTETQAHLVALHETKDGGWYRQCQCGWTSATYRDRRSADVALPCPCDPTVRVLITLQFSWGGLLDARPTADNYAVHLVRQAATGTPGPALCGIERFGPDAPGWSLGGGVTGAGIEHRPCAGCADVARAEFPGLPIVGSVGAREMAAELGREVIR
jgi:hypothetical protein